MELEQALGDGKIATFLNRDPAPRRQENWIKCDERLDIVISEYYSYGTEGCGCNNVILARID